MANNFFAYTHTGGHFWYPLSSKVKILDEETIKLLKYGSWATSAGHADFYVIQAISPYHTPGDYSHFNSYLVYKVRGGRRGSKEGNSHSMIRIVLLEW